MLTRFLRMLIIINKMLSDQINTFFKGFVPAVAILAIVSFVAWVRSVLNEKRRNTINSVDLTGKKIKFEIDSKPINALVDDSNDKHKVKQPK